LPDSGQKNILLYPSCQRKIVSFHFLSLPKFPHGGSGAVNLLADPGLKAWAMVSDRCAVKSDVIFAG
jgi:hypothetical protein